MKILGICLILFSGIVLGHLQAQYYLTRVRVLEELQLAFEMLDTEICYTQTLLARALSRVATRTEGSVSRLFAVTARSLMGEGERDFNKLWTEVVMGEAGRLCLRKGDCRLLEDWGKSLGHCPLSEQHKFNQLLLEQLSLKEIEARELADKRVKLSHYSGVLLALLVIIFLY